MKKEASNEDYVQAMQGMESAAINSAELSCLLASSTPPVVIDLRGANDQCHEGAVKIPMENLVQEVVGRVVPSNGTMIVLVCNQSFEMTRMVALSSYAYPTLKLMGYANLRILRDWSLG